MIDLHAHFLPGIDDGSKDPAESAQMLRKSYEQGVDVIVATPHFDARRQNPDSFLERRQQALERIAYDSSTMPKILLGAEVAYYDGISRSESARKLCIEGSNLLLLEMPFITWTERMVEDICALSRQQEIVPVLAHIERYFRYFPSRKTLTNLCYEGVFLQSNGEFFLARFQGIRAMKMLRQGLIQFIGSDCHGMEHRPPNLGAAARIIREKAGGSVLSELDLRSRQLLKLPEL